jgi:hypothetical protein
MMGWPEDVYNSPAQRAPEYRPSEFYRAHKGKLYEPIKFRKSLTTPKRRVSVLLLPATNPIDEGIEN